MLKLCNNSLNIKKKNPRMYITSIVFIFSLHFYIHSMKSFNVAMICICKQSKHLLYQHILKQKSSEKFLVQSTSKSKVQSSSSVCYFFFFTFMDNLSKYRRKTTIRKLWENRY